MHVNKTKFERNSSLEYYHMTCVGKTKHKQKRSICCVESFAIIIGNQLIEKREDQN